MLNLQSLTLLSDLVLQKSLHWIALRENWIALRETMFCPLLNETDLQAHSLKVSEFELFLLLLYTNSQSCTV